MILENSSFWLRWSLVIIVLSSSIHEPLSGFWPLHHYSWSSRAGISSQAPRTVSAYSLHFKGGGISRLSPCPISLSTAPQTSPDLILHALPSRWARKRLSGGYPAFFLLKFCCSTSFLKKRIFYFIMSCMYARVQVQERRALGALKLKWYEFVSPL